MITLRHERENDTAAREALLDEAFGKTRRKKASERLREGRLPAAGLSFIASDGRCVIGTARLWNIVCASGQSALLLGPVAVAPGRRDNGIGAALVRKAVREARKLGHAAIVLVGDPPYYSRFGFCSEKTAGLRMPGPYERRRLLAIELIPGALDSAAGMIAATGRPVNVPGTKIAARAA